MRLMGLRQEFRQVEFRPLIVGALPDDCSFGADLETEDLLR